MTPPYQTCLVAVERRIPTTGTPLASAIAELVSIRDKNYGQSGPYNALVQSRLTVERVTLVAGLDEIRLAGAVSLGDACDAPRASATRPGTPAPSAAGQTTVFDCTGNSASPCQWRTSRRMSPSRR